MSWRERLSRWGRRSAGGATPLPVAAEAMARQLVAASPDCLKVLDADGKVLWMNATGCRLMEIGDMQEVLGRPWLEFWAADARAAAKLAIATAKEGGAGRFAGPCATAKGTLKWWEVVVAPTSPDRPETGALLVVSREVSALRDAALARDTLAAAEQLARMDAERAMSDRDELVAMVAHELRAPLQAILTWSVFLQSESMDPAAVEAGRTIHGVVLHQQGVIDALLHDADNPLTAAALMPMDVGAAAREVVGGLRQIAAAKRIDLQLTDSADQQARIAGDGSTVRQILVNVLANALKFTPVGGTVGVTVSESDRDVLVVVTDSGRGITEEFMPRLFERYSQEKRGTDFPQGTGLGLFLARRFVTALGGTIRCESDGEGRGATFSIRFPKLVSETAATAPVVTDNGMRGSLSGVSVLVAAASGAAFETMAEGLRHFGARVLTPEQCRMPASRPRVDGIVAHLDYPELDALLTLTRNHPAPPWVLALTADQTMRTSGDGLHPKFDGVLNLPVPPRLLARAVATLQSRATL